MSGGVIKQSVHVLGSLISSMQSVCHQAVQVSNRVEKKRKVKARAHTHKRHNGEPSPVIPHIFHLLEYTIYKSPNMAAKIPAAPATAVLGLNALASLFLVVELPPVVGVFPMLPGFVTLPAQTYLPLMTLLEPWMALNVAQDFVMSAEDWRLNAPRLSLSAGRVTLLVRVLVGCIMIAMGDERSGSVVNLLSEVAVEVKGSGNGLDSREGHLGQLGVVLDLETTVDDLEDREGDVGQLGVCVNGQSTTNAGQVWSEDGGHGVFVETKGSSDVVQGRNGHAWACAEGQVLGSLQVGKAGGETVTIALQGEGLGDAGDLEADVLE
jgi:hypothetical protein